MKQVPATVLIDIWTNLYSKRLKSGQKVFLLLQNFLFATKSDSDEISTCSQEPLKGLISFSLASQSWHVPAYDNYVFKPRLLFLIFSSFYTENYFSSQQDSNSDHQSRRRGCWPLDHHHRRPTLVRGYIFTMVLCYLHSNKKEASIIYAAMSRSDYFITG